MNKKKCGIAIALLLSFVLWTMAVTYIDVAPIGPNGSKVGFSTLNGWFHRLTDVHMTLYTITDWLSFVPVAVAFGFAVLGLWQWICRRRLCRVDTDILLLGGFYVVVLAVYLLFESVVINYRPVLIAGFLEASYPSSTTLLTLCVMLTALRRHRHRLPTTIISIFTAFMVVGRLLSGVHWLSDILGGILVSGGLVLLYDVACRHFGE